MLKMFFTKCLKKNYKPKNKKPVPHHYYAIKNTFMSHEQL